MCCTRLAGNTGCKNDASHRHLCTIVQICCAVSSQLRHASATGKKLVKQQYVLHMSPQYGPTNGWDLLASFGHLSKLQRVLRLAFVTAATSLTGSQPNCMMFDHLLCCYTVYTYSVALAHWQNFAPCKIHFTSKSCVLLYCQRLHATPAAGVSQTPNYAAW